MLQFIPPSLSNATVPEDATVEATIGVGAQQGTSCFSFNLYGINLGCDSQGPDCVFTFTGQKFDNVAKKDQTVLSQTVHVPACIKSDGCELQHVSVDGFTDLTSVLVGLKVDDEDQIWWGDDIDLGWYDNHCSMSVCRSNVRDSILAKLQGRRWEA